MNGSRLLAPSGGSWMSAIPPLSGDKETSSERVATAACDPQPSLAMGVVVVQHFALALRALCRGARGDVRATIRLSQRHAG